MWIDAKKYWVKPKKLRVFCDTSEADFVIEHPLISTPICIHYYACVNAVLGPVAYKEVTGTTGLRKKYQVGTGCCVWGGAGGVDVWGGGTCRQSGAGGRVGRS